MLNEIVTLFRRRRTVASIAALCAIPVLIVLAVELSSNDPRSGEGPPFLDQITRNGFFVSLTTLAIVTPFLLPLMVSIVAGDAIAGEANNGTLRYLLVRPVGRTRLLAVKYASIVVFSVVASVAVVFTGILIGAAFFGIGDVITLSGTRIGLGDATWRALLASLYVAASMSALGAVGLFISTLTDQPIGAMVSTVAFAVVCEILDAVPQLEAIHGALLTHQWQAFVDLFRQPVALGDIGDGLLLSLVWAVVFLSAAWARFAGKDISS